MFFQLVTMISRTVWHAFDEHELGGGMLRNLRFLLSNYGLLARIPSVFDLLGKDTSSAPPRPGAFCVTSAGTRRSVLSY
mgnify:CR=1 FL=1